jgi:hypothetical protein
MQKNGNNKKQHLQHNHIKDFCYTHHEVPFRSSFHICRLLPLRRWRLDGLASVESRRLNDDEQYFGHG